MKNKHGRLTKAKKRIGVILAALMLLGIISPAAFANTEETSAVCSHEHSEECSFQQAEPCRLVCEHDEGCGYDGENAESCAILAAHEHDEACGYSVGAECSHEHDEACGFIDEAVSETIDEATNSETGEAAETACQCEPGCVGGTDCACGFCEAAIGGGSHEEACACGFDLAPITRDAPEASFIASFNGVDMTQPGASFVTTLADAWSGTYGLSVKATFDSANAAKEVTVNIIPGLGLSVAPGMVLSNGAWVYDTGANPLPAQLQGIVEGAEWTPAPPAANGYQSLAGKLVYKLNASTESVALDLMLKYERPYLLNGGQLITNNIITIETKQAGAQRNSAALNATVNGATDMYVGGMSETPQLVGRGSEYELVILTASFDAAGTGTYNYGGIDFIYNEYQLFLAFPKEMGIAEVIPRGVTTADDFVYSIDKSDSENDILSITFKDTTKNMNYGSGGSHFIVKGRLAEDAAEGQQYAFAVAGSRVTFSDGSVKENHAIRSKFSAIIQASLDIEGFKFSELYYPYIHEDEINSSSAMIAVGGIDISNRGADEITGRRIRFDFSDPAAGVKAARLLVGTGGGSDLIAVTSDGRTITQATLAPQNSAYSGAKYSIWLPELNENEYIKSLEYSVGSVPVGAGPNKYGFMSPFYADAGVIFYGRLFSTPDSYSFTATALKPVSEGASPENTDDESFWVKEEVYTQPMLVKRSGAVITTYQSNTSTATGANIMGGEKEGKRIQAGFTFLTFRYDYGYLQSFKGVEAYVRQPEGIQLSNIKAIWNGNSYPVTSSHKDSTGATIHVISMPEVILGSATSQLELYSGITVQADVTAANTMPSQSISLRDIFYIRAVGADYNKAYRVNDFTDVDGSICGIENMTLATVTDLEKINITAQQQFAAGTSADRGDGEWKVYLGTTETTINLNTQLKTRYRLNVLNSSGAVIPEGFTAIIPIPKTNTTTGLADVQSEKFGWSLYVDEGTGIVLEGSGHLDKYSVQYATTYAYMQAKDHTGWKNWADLSSEDRKDICAVKVTYTGDIPDGFADEFYFELNVPQNDEAFALQGKVNTYSALLYANVKGNAAYRKSEPVSLRLNTGIVSGSVKMDNDFDGAFSGADSAVQGVKVEAYKAGEARIADNLMESTYTDSSGGYQFTALSSEQDVDIVFTNPGTSLNPLRFVAPVADDESGSTATLAGITPSGGSHTENNALLQKPFTVSFDPGTGSPLPQPQKVYVGGKAQRPEQDPAKTGHVFKGWYKDEIKSELFDFNGSITGDTVIFASYEIISVTVNYDSNGGSPVASTAGDYGSTIAAEPVPTRSGYEFMGWKTSGTASKWVFGAEGTALTPANGVVNNEGDHSLALTAQWEIIEYSISYELNGGSAAGNPVKYTVEDLPLALNAPTRTGHTFTGWSSGDAALEGANNSVIPAGTTGDITIGAAWDTNVPDISAEKTTIRLNTNSAAASDIAYGAFSEEALLDFINLDTTSHANDASLVITTNFNEVKGASGNWMPANPAASYTVLVTATDSAGSNSIAITVNVLDNTPPAFQAENLDYRKGSIISRQDILESSVSGLSDDYTGTAAIFMNIEGMDGLNSEAEGKYQLNVTATDSSGNTTKKALTVTIWSESLVLKNSVLVASDVAAFDGNPDKYMQLIVQSAVYNDGEEADINRSTLSIENLGSLLPVEGRYTLAVKTQRGTREECLIQVLADTAFVVYKYNVPGVPDGRSKVKVGAVVPGPQSVNYENHVLDGWINKATGKTWSFTDGVMPREGLVLEASWTYAPPYVPPTEPTPGATTGPAAPRPTASPGASPSPAPSASPTPSPEANQPTAAPTIAPTAAPGGDGNTDGAGEDNAGGENNDDDTLNMDTIQGQDTPLAQLFAKGSWAVVNLLLSIGAAVFIVINFSWLAGKRRENKALSKIMALASFVLGAAIPLLFIIGSNFSAKAMAVDYLTIPLLVLFISQMITTLLPARKKPQHTFFNNDTTSAD